MKKIRSHPILAGQICHKGNSDFILFHSKYSGIKPGRYQQKTETSQEYCIEPAAHARVLWVYYPYCPFYELQTRLCHHAVKLLYTNVYACITFYTSFSGGFTAKDRKNHLSHNPCQQTRALSGCFSPKPQTVFLFYQRKNIAHALYRLRKSHAGFFTSGRN